MNITKAQYAKHPSIEGNVSVTATIDGEELSIPLDPINRHYAAILEWAKEDGNTIQEAD